VGLGVAELLSTGFGSWPPTAAVWYLVRQALGRSWHSDLPTSLLLLLRVFGLEGTFGAGQVHIFKR